LIQNEGTGMILALSYLPRARTKESSHEQVLTLPTLGFFQPTLPLWFILGDFSKSCSSLLSKVARLGVLKAIVDLTLQDGLQLFEALLLMFAQVANGKHILDTLLAKDHL